MTPQNQDVHDGRYANFHCSSFVYPQWTFVGDFSKHDIQNINSKKLPSNAVQVTKPKGGLLIVDARFSNQGYYECRGKTKLNYKFLSYGRLIVRGK